MIITQYSFNNSVTPEFKWTFFEERNNLDELINIPNKAEERSMIQISFRTHDPNIPESPSKITPIRSIYRKNPQSVRFLRPNPSIRKPIHPPLRELKQLLQSK